MEPNDVDLEALVELRYQLPEWVVFREVSTGTGSHHRGAIDLAAFNSYPSKGDRRLAFEVKRSRADFLRELKNPKKREWVERGFHETYFVTPADPSIAPADEIPDGWGLLRAQKNGKQLRRAKVARSREIAEPGKLGYFFAMSLLRRAAQAVNARHRVGGDELTTDELEAIIGERVDDRLESALGYERKRLERDRAELARERKELEDERVKMRGPLERLGQVARRRSWDWDQILREPEAVEEWLDHVGTINSRELVHKLAGLRRGLEGAIETIAIVYGEKSLRDTVAEGLRRAGATSTAYGPEDGA